MWGMHSLKFDKEESLPKLFFMAGISVKKSCVSHEPGTDLETN